MFIAAIFTIAKISKQPVHQQINGFKKKYGVNIYIYIYIMKYYSAIKKEGNSVTCNNIDGPRGYYAY